MPISPENRILYPPNWKAISERIRHERAKDKCEWCDAPNHEPHPMTGSHVVLTVAHLDHDPANNDDGNLAALCQRCHNTYDAPKRHGNRRRRIERAALEAGQLALL